MSQPPGAAEENSLTRAFRAWSASCPFASRCTIMAMVGSWVLSVFLPWLDFALLNSPILTISQFEVYRVLTSVCSGASLIGVLFGVLSFNQIGPNLEKSLGSTGMLALMGTLIVASNLAFLLCCAFFAYMGVAWAYHASGWWNLVIALIAVESMAAPEAPRRFFLVPFNIPGKYYPLFVAFIFMLMNRGDFCALGTAVGIGYAYAMGKLEFLKPSRSRLSGWESGCLYNFVQNPGYITTASAMGAQVWAPLNNPVDHPSNQRPQGGGGFSSLFGGRSAGGDGGGGSEDDGGESGFGRNNVIKREGGATEGSSATGTAAAGRGRNVFGGSGQTLGGGGGAGGTRLAGRSQTLHDPATARAARLAALEARGAGGKGEGEGRSGQRGESMAPLLGSSDHDVLTLQDMGFTAADAREALQRTDGDVEAAASYLSG